MGSAYSTQGKQDKPRDKNLGEISGKLTTLNTWSTREDPEFTVMTQNWTDTECSDVILGRDRRTYFTTQG
jgi:hypothetical protein